MVAAVTSTMTDDEFDKRWAQYEANGKKPGAMQRALYGAFEKLGENEQDQVIEDISPRGGTADTTGSEPVVRKDV